MSASATGLGVTSSAEFWSFSSSTVSTGAVTERNLVAKCQLNKTCSSFDFSSAKRALGSAFRRHRHLQSRIGLRPSLPS